MCLLLRVAFGSAVFVSVILVLSRFVTIEALIGDKLATVVAALSVASSIAQYLAAPVAIVAVVWFALKYTERVGAAR
jgi:hypothetical protein